MYFSHHCIFCLCIPPTFKCCVSPALGLLKKRQLCLRTGLQNKSTIKVVRGASSKVKSKISLVKKCVFLGHLSTKFQNKCKLKKKRTLHTNSKLKLGFLESTLKNEN